MRKGFHGVIVVLKPVTDVSERLSSSPVMKMGVVRFSERFVSSTRPHVVTAQTTKV
jgi:hypothetical protein